MTPEEQAKLEHQARVMAAISEQLADIARQYDARTVTFMVAGFLGALMNALIAADRMTGDEAEAILDQLTDITYAISPGESRIVLPENLTSGRLN